MSMIRKISFGFIAVVVIPAVFFFALEQVLGWVGPGKSFAYFNTIEIDGTEGSRFFMGTLRKDTPHRQYGWNKWDLQLLSTERQL